MIAMLGRCLRPCSLRVGGRSRWFGLLSTMANNHLYHKMLLERGDIQPLRSCIKSDTNAHFHHRRDAKQESGKSTTRKLEIGSYRKHRDMCRIGRYTRQTRKPRPNPYLRERGTSVARSLSSLHTGVCC